MLKIENLSLTLNNKCLLDNLNILVQPNSVVALVGKSGSGKTITAKSIIRLLNKEMLTEGKILWKNKNLIECSEKELRRIRGKEIGYIWQDIDYALNPLKTVGAQIEEIFWLHTPLKSQQIKQKIRHLIASHNLDSELMDRYPHQLSGGQKQRVLIAIGLALQPALVIADEPTSALDQGLQQHFINTFNDYKQVGSILLISHDTQLIENVADEIIFIGNNIESENRKRTRQAGCIASSLLNNIPNEVIFRFENISKEYRSHSWFAQKSKKIVDNVSFSIKQSHNVGLMGESGSGKSTIAKMMVKYESNTSGNIFFREKEISQLSQKRFRPYRSKIQLIFQDPHSSLNPSMNIEQTFLEGLRIHKPHFGTREIKYFLEKVGLETDVLKHYPHQFSGGEKQRIAIARTLIIGPELLILDEPTSALDQGSKELLINLLQNIQGEMPITYFIITHEPDLIDQLCHELIILKDGKIIENGPSDYILKETENDYSKRILGKPL